LTEATEYWEQPIVSANLIKLILGDRTCRLYLLRLVDNLRTKVRSRVENLQLFISEEEDAYLRDLFLSGKEKNLRQEQLDEEAGTSPKKPQTIVEKIMLILGFLCVEKNKPVVHDASAHMEAVVLAALIWR
jgi:hypothetical protein